MLEPSRFLAASPLFASVDPGLLARFDSAAHRRLLPGGDTLFRQGDAADALYVVVRGSLRVILEEAGGSRRFVDTLRRGEIVGELALLLNDARTATVTACRDSELLRIDRGEFEDLVAAHPSIAIAVARTLSERLKRTTRRGPAVPTGRTIAVLPLTPGALSGRFVAGLAEALGDAALTSPAGGGPPGAEGADRVSVVTSSRVEAEFPGVFLDGAADDQSRAALAWMSELEDRHPYVVYLADAARPAWTSRCLRQADVTLLVVDAVADPVSEPIARQLRAGDPRLGPVELVLLHDSAAGAISGTARWLEALRVDRHYHVRAGRPDDCRRVARFLTGGAVGVVLSGGGARGLAHIGVLKALVAHGWPIDAIGGASMGAIVGALYAAGHGIDELTALVRREFAGRQERDVTLPVAALSSGAATVRKMHRLYGDRCIEDLPLPFYCTSTNLTRAQPMVHDRGPLWLGIRTSSAIPGLAPPVPLHGDLLVDGGLLNNLPADVMRRRCDGVVIGVDVTPGVDLRWEADSRTHVSGWTLLGERLLASGDAPRFPGIVEILSRTAMAASIRDAADMAALCDVYLRPEVAQFGMTEFGKLDALVGAGYAAADAALASRTAAPRQ
jgi:NTE family protein